MVKIITYNIKEWSTTVKKSEDSDIGVALQNSKLNDQSKEMER